MPFPAGRRRPALAGTARRVRAVPDRSGTAAMPGPVPNEARVPGPGSLSFPAVAAGSGTVPAAV